MLYVYFYKTGFKKLNLCRRIKAMNSIIMNLITNDYSVNFVSVDTKKH